MSSSTSKSNSVINPDDQSTCQLREICVESIAEDAASTLAFLEQAGTFGFPTLATGLFSAAVGDGEELAQTGYRSVWVRDNVHIAHAHWVWGETDKSVAATRTLLSFFHKYQHRFDDAIARSCDTNDPMERPHIRFDGERLEELDEKWSHAQNDALGGLLWLASRLVNAGAFKPTGEEKHTLESLAKFLHHVEFWRDEDSGHWEEIRKVAASSIGVATAGAEQYRDWLTKLNHTDSDPPLSDLANSLCREGRSQLDSILPWECRQYDAAKQRRFDSALLFLIYPYRVVEPSTADAIVADVTSNLMGPYGVKRYLGDSYWCSDYKEKLSADVRTADFSDDMSGRDQLLEPGAEAQWCLFDPILAIHFGMKYERTHDPVDRQLQVKHLNRSLGQLTKAGSSAGPYRCPESYYRAKGVYVPNDICPLLWTQANLKLALWQAAGKAI